MRLIGEARTVVKHVTGDPERRECELEPQRPPAVDERVGHQLRDDQLELREPVGGQRRAETAEFAPGQRHGRGAARERSRERKEVDRPGAAGVGCGAEEHVRITAARRAPAVTAL